jgi:HlyD family secretion protein
VPYSGAVLLLGLIAFGLWPQPLPIETARVTVGSLRATVNEEGKTRIKQRYTVSAPVTGQLRRIELKPGAEVRAGDTVVAVIDPLSPSMLDARSRTLAEAKRDTARANLEKAKLAHQFATSELRRFEKLYADKSISVQELEPVQWREASTARDQVAAESALRQSEAELAEFAPNTEAAAQACRAPTEVKAPASGRVLRVVEESARVIAAGAPLMEVGDPADLEAVIEVLSRDGAAITPGTKVELEQWGGGNPLKARVRLVEPAAFTKVSALGVEEQRVNVVVDILTPPQERPSLGDAFRVEASIIMWESDHALKVPSGALFRRGSQWAAFVLDGSRTRLRLVKVGKSSATETEILDGLKAGDEVILYPGDRVHEGSRVKPTTIS